MSTHRSWEASLCLFLKLPETQAMTLYCHVLYLWSQYQWRQVTATLDCVISGPQVPSYVTGSNTNIKPKHLEYVCRPACMSVWQPAGLPISNLCAVCQGSEMRVHQSDLKLKLKKAAFVWSWRDWRPGEPCESALFTDDVVVARASSCSFNSYTPTVQLNVKRSVSELWH